MKYTFRPISLNSTVFIVLLSWWFRKIKHLIFFRLFFISLHLAHFIVSRSLILMHIFLFIFKPPWKRSYTKLWIMHMTYAACLTEEIEEPESSLHFWSWVAGRAENRGSKAWVRSFGDSEVKARGGVRSCCRRDANYMEHIGCAQSWPEIKYNIVIVSITS